jgi:hypothetical protein
LPAALSRFSRSPIQLTNAERLEHLFGPFGLLTVVDKVPAEEVHRAFREIDEHRAVMQRYRDDRAA